MTEDSTGRNRDAASKQGNPAASGGDYVTGPACASVMENQHLGYVKLWRKLRTSACFQDSVVLHVWIYCLLYATHKPIGVSFRGKPIMLQPGQFTAGQRQIARETHLTQKQVRRALEFLKLGTQLGQQKSNRCSLFTILNWSDYQAEGQQEGTQRAHRGHTEGTQRAPKQEEENIRMEESVVVGYPSSKVHATGADAPKPKFVPPTTQEAELQAAKIGMAPADRDEFVAYYQSNGWRVGRNPMRNWQAAMTRWNLRSKNYGHDKPNGKPRANSRNAGTLNEGLHQQFDMEALRAAGKVI